jgi:hypothetical protein
VNIIGEIVKSRLLAAKYTIGVNYAMISSTRDLKPLDVKYKEWNLIKLRKLGA